MILRSTNYLQADPILPALPAPINLWSGNTMLNSLGATDVVTKEWFSVSVYRNILDMLNTAQIELFNLNKALRNCAMYGIVASRFKDRGLIGYAISKVGQYGENSTYSYQEYVNRLLEAIQLQPFLLKDPTILSLQTKAGRKDQGDYGATDGTPIFCNVNTYRLLDLMRSIEWEMNRVRLPVPPNIRQYINLADQYNLNTSVVQKADYNVVASTAAFIGITEILANARIVANAVTAMQTEVRNAIDQANLAAKVQEETLRKENEAIATAKKIEEEKIAAKAALEKERLQRAVALAKEATQKQTQVVTAKPVTTTVTNAQQTTTQKPTNIAVPAAAAAALFFLMG